MSYPSSLYMLEDLVYKFQKLSRRMDMALLYADNDILNLPPGMEELSASIDFIHDIRFELQEASAEGMLIVKELFDERKKISQLDSEEAPKKRRGRKKTESEQKVAEEPTPTQEVKEEESEDDEVVVISDEEDDE